MRTHNLTLKKMLASICVTVPLHIPDITDITSLTNNFTTSESNETHPPTYGYLHRPLINQDEPNNKTVPYKKYLMTLIKFMIACNLLGRKNLVQVSSFWF